MVDVLQAQERQSLLTPFDRPTRQYIMAKRSSSASDKENSTNLSGAPVYDHFLLAPSPSYAPYFPHSSAQGEETEGTNDDQRAQPSPVSRTGEKRDSSIDGAPPSKRSVAGFNPVLSPELLATLPKKEIVAQLRAHGLAAPVCCTVADLRQGLLAYLARHW